MAQLFRRTIHCHPLVRIFIVTDSDPQIASYGLIIYKNLGVNVYLFCFLDFHGLPYFKEFFLQELLYYEWVLWLPFKGRLATNPSN